MNPCFRELSDESMLWETMGACPGKGRNQWLEKAFNQLFAIALLMEKAILLILDGLGDMPDKRGNTPLSAARKPNTDKMAAEGETGLLSPIGRGNVPGSDTSHLTLLGYPYWEYYCGRGPLEALGSGIELKEGDVAFRANFATVRGGKILDRRAGRISTPLGRKLEKYVGRMKIGGCEVLFKSTVEHRGVVVIRGKGLGDCVSDTDPHRPGRLCEARALKKGSEKTARILNEFGRIAMEKLGAAAENKGRKLPANAILCRGSGKFRKVEPFEKRHGMRGACVAGGALYKGVARYIGMDVLEARGATGTSDTDLKAKGRKALEALENHEFVFVHVKATDSFAHDGDFGGKKGFIERVDKELVPILRKSGANIIICGDHSTCCGCGKHTGHPVPALFWGKGFRKDACRKFDEFSCMGGGEGHLDGWDLFPLIINAMGRGKKVGS